MATRKTPFIKGEYYHIYNRGNSKQKIFLDESDYKHFTKLLFICNSKINFKFRDNIVDPKIDAFKFERGEQIISIGAWVLMPNHFHLYLTIDPERSDEWENNEKNYISEFMRKLSTSYVKYFNKKYDRTGGLFEGSFKAVHIKGDNQAKYLFSYIHLNPVKIIQEDWKEEGLKDIKLVLEFLDQYKWSSYFDYKKITRRENKILNTKSFPNYFKDIEDFDNEILGWLNCKKKV